MSENDFGKLVQKAILALPKHIRGKVKNLAIVIEKRPLPYHLREARIKESNSLLGLYQGVPKTTWGRGFGQRLPDKITIFQEPIENLANSEKDIMEIVRNTVWHEIAHHFGFNEKRVRELESKWRNKKIL